MKFIKLAKILAVSSAVISIGGIAEAATVSGGSGTYDLGAELLELEFTVDSIIDGDTPAGIRTVAFDFDGGTNPFRATTTLLSSSVAGASILDIDPAGDGILIDLGSPIETAPITFTFLFGDIDTASIDVGTDKFVDLRFNTGDANNDTSFQEPDFFRSGPDNLFAVQAVPEPLTILGAGSAIAFGTAFKRKLGKKKA